MVDSAFLIGAFVTMFVIIDPIGLSPLFIALTQGLTPKQKRHVAIRACLIALFILGLFGFFGEALLGFIGISMPAFRVAGGLLLFLTALEMLFEKRTKRRHTHAEETEEEEEHDPSVFPLAIPLIAGPGSITSVILLSGQQPGAEGLVLVLGITAAILALVFVMFLLSGIFERALGKTGITVVTRLLGMLLAALSVQFVLDGLRAFSIVSSASG